jgi:hypothetical protein
MLERPWLYAARMLEMLEWIPDRGRGTRSASGHGRRAPLAWCIAPQDIAGYCMDSRQGARAGMRPFGPGPQARACKPLPVR